MEKKNSKIYASKDILLGYVTTVNPDSYTIEGQIIKTVLPFKIKKVNRNESRIVPLYTYFPYYSIDKTVPITEKMHHKNVLITSIEIDKIVEMEKKNQQNEIKDKQVNNSYYMMNDKEKVNRIENELDIQKIKRFVA